MPLKLLRVVPTPGLSKKYAAVFVLPNGRQRTVRFGTASNYVSNPRKTARGDRTAYIARHRVNENHNDPLTPGALSRWLLWGESAFGKERGGTKLLSELRCHPSTGSEARVQAQRSLGPERGSASVQGRSPRRNKGYVPVHELAKLRRDRPSRSELVRCVCSLRRGL